jgi:hypothetical protein
VYVPVCPDGYVFDAYGNCVLATTGVSGAYCSGDVPPRGTGDFIDLINRRGVGAAGASAFTMTAAQALNDYLVTNNCAGCNDMTSPLRQLTFAFKAAYLTDTGISPVMNLNMSSALAMTAYGTATDQALKQVLGASAYANGPCTDDNGYCLGNIATPSVPQGAKTGEQNFVHAIQTALQQVQFTPQPELVNGLVQGFAALINQIGFELAKAQPASIANQYGPPPPGYTRDANGNLVPIVGPGGKQVTTTDGTTTAGWTTGEKIAAGIGAGVVLTGVAYLVYTAAKGS